MSGSLWQNRSDILNKAFEVSFGDTYLVIYELYRKGNANSVESFGLSVTRGTVIDAIFRNQNLNGGGLQAVWADDLISVVPEAMELVVPGDLIIDSEDKYNLEMSNGAIGFKRNTDDLDDLDLNPLGELQIFFFIGSSPESITLDANSSRLVLSLDNDKDEPHENSEWEVIRGTSACQDDAETLIRDSQSRVAYDRFNNWLSSILRMHLSSTQSCIDVSIEKFNAL